MNNILRRKKKKSMSGRQNGFLSKNPKLSRSSRSISADDPDFGGSVSKRNSAELGKSVSFDEDGEDQVFGRSDERDGESRPASQLGDDDDTLSVISENFFNEETVCGLNHEHLSMKIMDEVFQIDIERMFELLFTDPPFQDELAKRRKIFDVKSMPWAENTEGDGLKSRTLSFSVPINISFCPKRADSVEKQNLDVSSKPGRRYIVDSETDTSGIPYGDTFTLLTRFCVTRVTRRSCRVNVTGQLRYKKHVMAVIKSLVHKTCVNGFNNNFTILTELLRDEEARITGKVRPLTAGSEEGGSTSSSPGDRSRPDGALTPKGLTPDSETPYSNGVAGKSGDLSKHHPSSFLSGNHSVLSTPVSKFLVVVLLLFVVLMCVNISLMVMLFTMDLPQLASYSQLGNSPSTAYQSSEKVLTQGTTGPSVESPLHGLLNHITTLREDLKSDLSRYEASRRFASPDDLLDSNDSCQGENSLAGNCRRKNVADPTLREIVALQSELHAAHLTRLYNTLSATTDLMKIVQQSLQDLLKAGITVESDTGMNQAISNSQ